jgi:hypothetical protein
MLLSFFEFVQQQDGVEQTGVSSPEHESGEESLSLNKVIEKRIKEIVVEFTMKRKATEEEVLNSIDYNIKRILGGNSNKQNSQPQQPQDLSQLDQSQQQKTQ